MDAVTEPAGRLAGREPARQHATWGLYGTLWGLHALLAFLLFREFFDGSRYFAYLDIGSDTYDTFTGHTVHLARLFAREGFSGWSFTAGWGAPIAFMLADPFRFLAMAGGPDQVLALRIWVYVLKIVLGGTFFLLMARPLVRREAALLGALAYSFCGYIVSNGQWDSETLPFVFFPLILWAIGRYLRTRDLVALPLAVGAALLFGVFFVTLAVSLAIAFAACVAASDDRRAATRQWLTGIAPLVALGFVLGAPLALPGALQLLDSPRVGGQDSLVQRLFVGALSVSDWPLLVQQVGALFHKDLFGIGSFHHAYMNYLESPGFYVGLLPLLAAAQLWNGSRAERRLLVVGMAGVLLYFAFPMLRLAAFGFASPYFRATTLWVTIGLLWLGVYGVDRILREGVQRRALVVAAVVLAALLGGVAWVAPYVSPVHAYETVAFLLAWTALLLVLGTGSRRARLVPAVLLLCVVELVASAWPSYFVLRRTASASDLPADDVTVPALQAIRRADPSPFFRVEKTYLSRSQADSLLQDYYGVQSYYYHGRALIDFHQGVDMLPPWGPSPPVNKTNWTAAPGDRYMLHSLLGVRYVISKSREEWPGFRPFASGDGWFVYRNELALPLGFVQSRQVTRAEIAQLARLPVEQERWIKDVAVVNAVVLDQPLPQWGERYDLAAVPARGAADLAKLYEQPARALQRTGLAIDSFRNDHITGRIAPERAGILVFSIPAYRGWSLTIDGQPTPLITANFGMLAAPVAAGPHRVELTYTMPGLRAGIALGAAGMLLLGGLRWRVRRGNRAGTLAAS